ncbi:MAG: glucan biosynthesis protein G [Pseudomonadota bacterium]|nr:glucan biosynthesis protein G [Pseudomonadota bacterium]
MPTACRPVSGKCLARLAGLLCAGLYLLGPFAAHANSVTNYPTLIQHAKELAEQPYEPRQVTLPPALQGLDYDAYRDIRFRPDQSVWRGRGLPIEAQFFHLGLYYDTPVQIHLLTADGVQAVDYTTKLFDYGSNPTPTEVDKHMGFAGFRLHYPLNRPDYKDELIIFHGASYFRSLGAGQWLGLSARGLAIDTGERSGEEFPVFTQFWIEWPRRDARQFRILALLESESVTGAYEFLVTPGTSTTTDVKATLFQRGEFTKLGLAPLTSMFHYGEEVPRPPNDFRPEVHDSDGLLIHAGGEWLWRGLVNPGRLTINSFETNELHGFGLMQRDRDFSSYQDLEAHYHQRPSAWITPQGDWGEGAVELVQIPTKNEVNDNIVAYWRPKTGLSADEPLTFRYTIAWQHAELAGPDAGQVIATRIARAADAQGLHRYVIDFAGPALTTLPEDVELTPELGFPSHFVVAEQISFRNPETGGWRLVIKGKLKPDTGRPAELRASLLTPDRERVTEIWTYTEPAN